MQSLRKNVVSYHLVDYHIVVAGAHIHTPVEIPIVLKRNRPVPWLWDIRNATHLPYSSLVAQLRMA